MFGIDRGWLLNCMSAITGWKSGDQISAVKAGQVTSIVLEDDSPAAVNDVSVITVANEINNPPLLRNLAP